MNTENTTPAETTTTPATKGRRGGTPGPLRVFIRTYLETMAAQDTAVALADLVSTSGRTKPEVLVTVNNMKVAGVVVSKGRGFYTLA